MGTGNFEKFSLLMWKNWLLQWRHPYQTFVEILAPVLFSALLVLIRSLVEPHDHPQIRLFQPFNVPNNISFPYIAYFPNNKLITNIMEDAVSNIIYLNQFKPNATQVELKGFNNSMEMTNYLMENQINTLCGVQFDDKLINATKFPKKIHFSLRFPGESRKTSPLFLLSWKTNLLFPLYQVLGPRNPDNGDGGYPPGYNAERFTTVQHYVSYAIINNLKQNAEDLPVLTLRRYPYPPYIDDPLLIALASFIGIIIMLSFVYTCINTVKVITNEKEKQVKEVMKIMGLSNWLHWVAWFIKTFTFCLISIILIVILMKIEWIPGSNVSVFTNSNGIVIFLFLCCYMCATVTFCFMISSFFSKANTASTIAGLFWFLSYAPYLFFQQQYQTLSLVQKLTMCLCSNSAMAFGFQLILMFEGTGEGLQWESIMKPVTPDDTFTLGQVMLILLIDTIIYLLIALYVEAILPGEYGVPKPWYFLFTSNFWCGTKRFDDEKDIMQNGNGTVNTGEMYESEPNLCSGIQIKHLRKVFKNKKVAVRDLCLNMYEDQITALLGHNGAGKTTTMSLLTGMFPPTSGTAIIAGYDIWNNMREVRESLGLCPQHNVLFDDLTVKEHLYFFGKLKGLHNDDIEIDSLKYITLLELMPKIDSKAGTLSGGMKRKLSVGIALCGNSKIVMLDEPTAGMDPAARRAMWDLLQKEKKGRTMLLTTHFMDEADLLGDRIAIMAGGTLQCVGSSFFLKKRYGAGYHLTLEKSLQCNVTEVTELFRRYIPNIQFDTNVGSELTYRLPEEQLNVFESMLSDLENNASTLGILNYGISLTTLEEVFMKVGADHGQEEEQNALELAASNDASMLTINEANNEYEFTHRFSSETTLDLGNNLLTGFDLYVNQFRAMIIKKTFSSLRSWLLNLIQLVLPMIFLTIAILIVRTMKTTEDLPPLKISLASYDRPITLVSGDNDLAGSYSTFINKTLKENVVNVDNYLIFYYILMKAVENLPVVRLRYIVGATFNINCTLGWFSNEPFHALPLTLNLLHNAVLRQFVSDQEYSIQVTNEPLPYTAKTRMQQLIQGNSMGFQIAFNVGFSMAFASSFYIIFCVRERVTKAKHLQFVSGVNVFTFWISSYLFDMLHYLFMCVFLIITLVIFQEEGFRTFPELGRFFAVLTMFGFAMLPMTYLISFWFDIPSSGFTKMTFINIFTGVAAFLVVQILDQPQLELKHIANILDWIFTFIPQYSVSTSINHLYNTFSMMEICKTVSDFERAQLCLLQDKCCSENEDYFSWENENGIARNMIVFAGVGIVLFLILMINEFDLIRKTIYRLFQKNSKPPPPTEENEDDDVTSEKEKIQNLSQSEINTYSLLLRNFSKYYGDLLAVNKLSIGINGSECFGLLGINGAGKTTTFKMLTGDENISYGDAWVNGLSLKEKMKKVHKVIGYCPQFDALLDNLTGRETLTVFCLLRGVPYKESRYLVENLANEFNFKRHLDKKVKEYSGGNKRKLSTAVALIGDPTVVYLDEPSTGMDPAAKRHLWNGLCKVRDSGRCIVLTSHSMEECEALCTRLAIMVNGNFKCLGSTQHLKSKFSEGYTLTVKVRKLNSNEEITENEIEPIDGYIKQNFPSAVLREKYQELLTYYIADKNIPWSRMFGLMENGKTFLNIEDYSLGQSSLEQVFLNFTKHQREV